MHRLAALAVLAAILLAGPAWAAPQDNLVALGEFNGVIIHGEGYIAAPERLVGKVGSAHPVALPGQSGKSAVVVFKDEASGIALLHVAAKLPEPARWSTAPAGGTSSCFIVPAAPRQSFWAQIIAPHMPGFGLSPHGLTSVGDYRMAGGGGVYDRDGGLMGMLNGWVSAGSPEKGMGLFVPAATIRFVLDRFLAEGKVARGRLGIRFQPVEADLAEALGLKYAAGILVVEAPMGSPGQKAGLRTGDVILGWNGTEITNAQAFPLFVTTGAPGSAFEANVLRDGAAITARGTLAETLPAFPAPPASGAVLDRLHPGSVAAIAGLKSGYRVLAVGNKNISSDADLRTRLDEARKAGHRRIAVLAVAPDQSVSYYPLRVVGPDNRTAINPFADPS